MTFHCIVEGKVLSEREGRLFVTATRRNNMTGNNEKNTGGESRKQETNAAVSMVLLRQERGCTLWALLRTAPALNRHTRVNPKQQRPQSKAKQSKAKQSKAKQSMQSNRHHRRRSLSCPAPLPMPPPPPPPPVPASAEDEAESPPTAAPSVVEPEVLDEAAAGEAAEGGKNGPGNALPRENGEDDDGDNGSSSRPLPPSAPPAEGDAMKLGLRARPPPTPPPRIQAPLLLLLSSRLRSREGAPRFRDDDGNGDDEDGAARPAEGDWSQGFPATWKAVAGVDFDAWSP